MILERMALSAFCMDDNDVGKLGRRPKVTRTVVDSTTGERMQRKFTEVEVGRTVYLADIVTGTLYKRSGACMSSDRLRLEPCRD